MWTTFIVWFHHLFNPHCALCEADLEAKERCTKCEVLERQLELERARFNSVLNRVVAMGPTHTTSPEQVEEGLEDLKPMPSGKKFVPYAVKQREVQLNDEKTLELLINSRRRMDNLPTDRNDVRGTEDIDEKTTKLEQEVLGTNVLGHASAEK